MTITAVARRYAEALADIAIARGQTAQIEKELNAYAEMLSANRELCDTLASPVVSQKDKQKILDAILERTRPGGTTANLLQLLLRHHRLHNVGVVRDQFRREMNRREGVVPAEVTTAGPVGPAEQEMLTHQLERITGKRVQLQFKSDPTLIGGAVTRIGSVIYDGSIRTRLESLKQELKQGAGGL